jgi:hypothetical protein
MLAEEDSDDGHDDDELQVEEETDPAVRGVTLPAIFPLQLGE